ncbi:hypothetical protein GGF31_000079 [Allomyces arbusculus]|nr:hypothetical protein GGF31_000079 [Allomyces arbusculus]
MLPLSDDQARYLARRRLGDPWLGPWHLAAATIGIVISGLFFGWNAGLLKGWRNMAVATALAATLYATLVAVVTEMCCALPFASGPGAFAHAAFGPGAGALAGTIYAFSYVLLCASVLVALGDDLAVTFHDVNGSVPAPVLWLLIAAVVLALHARPRFYFRVVMVLSAFSLTLLATYLLFVIVTLPPHAHDEPVPDPLLLSPVTGPSAPGEIPVTFASVVACFPFAVWFFMGLEAFPTTAEEAVNIPKTAPKSVLCSSLVLLFLAVSLLAVVPDDGPSSMFAHSSYPLLDNVLHILCTNNNSAGASSSRDTAKNLAVDSLGAAPPMAEALSLTTVCGSPAAAAQHGVVRALVGTCLVPPLFLSLATGTYAAARHVYTLSRAGVLPTALARTLRHHGAPLLATGTALGASVIVAGLLKAVAALGPAPVAQASLAMFTSPNATVSQSILKVAVWIMCVGYVIEAASALAVTRRWPNLPRPFVSPLGWPGAVVALVLSAGMGLVAPLVTNPGFYVPVLGGLFGMLLVAWPYYALIASRRMVASPEKIFMQRQILHLYGRRRQQPDPTTTSSMSAFARRTAAVPQGPPGAMPRTLHDDGGAPTVRVTTVTAVLPRRGSATTISITSDDPNDDDLVLTTRSRVERIMRLWDALASAVPSWTRSAWLRCNPGNSQWFSLSRAMAPLEGGGAGGGGTRWDPNGTAPTVGLVPDETGVDVVEMDWVQFLQAHAAPPPPPTPPPASLELAASPSPGLHSLSTLLAPAVPPGRRASSADLTDMLPLHGGKDKPPTGALPRPRSWPCPATPTTTGSQSSAGRISAASATAYSVVVVAEDGVHVGSELA